jgi:ABC transport system ATP-binding/permease protein
MSYRLLINPGTPQAWEYQLRPGTNRVGRNEENDFTLNHESVSGAHCEITVSDAGIILKDLGSTNGTFVDRVPVTEIRLQPGQHVQMGQVDMTFEADASGT